MKIIALIMSFLIALTSFSLPSKAYDPLDIIRDTVRIVDKNIKNAVDAVEHATDMVWNNVNATIDYLTVPRKTYYPNDPDNMSPSITNNIVSNNNNDYTVNYYTCDSNNSTMVENNSYSYNSYYDYYTNNYYTTNNTTYITNTTNNYDYNTYQYEFNDNRVFITETYNSVIYTYVNPSTRTVDCYMLSFEMPSGDSSFNYSSGYCYGLYWVYDFVNYDYELDDNSLLAYWRFDGDLHNEVPNSNWSFCYSANEFGDGKFGSALRCNGPYSFCLYCPSMPTQFTVETWYFNGDPNYKGMDLGWHYLVWEFDGTTRYTYIDGVQVQASQFSQYDLYSFGSAREGISTGKMSASTPSYPIYELGGVIPSNTSIYHIDCYHPFIEPYPHLLGDISSGYPDDNHIWYRSGSSGFNLLSKMYYQPVNGATMNSNYSSIGVNPSPFYAPPYRVGNCVYYPYTGLEDFDYEKYQTQYLNSTIDGHFAVRVRTDNGYRWVWNLPENILDYVTTPVLWHTNSRSLVGRPDDYKGYVANFNSKPANWTDYDLSGCYFDDFVVYSGFRYHRAGANGGDLLPSVRFSRVELEVGYTAPSGVIDLNTIGIQSTVSVNQFRIGGVIPTVTHQGDVYFRLKDGYCVDCLQYIDGSWQSINFGVYDGSKWINGYSFNFYNLSFDTVDADSGTNSSVVYNYYYSGDNIYNDYLDNSASDDEKQSVISFMTNIITFLGTLFVFIGGAFPIFSFIPTWAIGLLFTFLPVCSILLVISITKHFLGGKK